MSIFSIGGGNASGDYEIDQSLRFDDGYLRKSFSTGTNPDKVTISCWVKPANLGATATTLFYGYSDASNYEKVVWNASGKMYWTGKVSGSTSFDCYTSMVFRDPSSWYHLVLVYDSAQSTASDRVNFYVNGVLQTKSTDTAPAQNLNSFLLSSSCSIGEDELNGSASYRFKSYMAECHAIDGQALTPASFGETNSATNQWVPIEVTGMTYGTNGFYQKYAATGGHTSFTSSGSWTAPTGVTSVDYLVVGGGAGGASASGGGGGGAGAFRSGTLSVTPGTTYSITVGEGGAGGSSSVGANGSDSIFSSITSNGGGGGGTSSGVANGNASGGGGGNGGSAGAGGTYGNAGGSGGTATVGGGGGGASAAGTAGVGSPYWGYGHGGAGSASSITGASVTYSGGGGGGVNHSGAGGNGGAGGGGGGASITQTPGNGTANTGGGGGGTSGNKDGGAGGSGIVVIKPAASFGLGLDSSGNGNNFTETNLIATDQVIDSPTNNFCTWNPLNSTDDAQFVMSEGNLETQASDTVNWIQDGTFYANSGKWYFEIYVEDLGVGNTMIGLVGENFDRDTYPYNAEPTYGYYMNGNYREGNSVNVSYGASYTTGDIIGVALDCDNGTVQFYKNNAGQGSKSGTNLTGRSVSPMIGGSHNGAAFIAIANFGSDSSFAGNKTAQGNGGDGEDFYYTPPTGYKALNTDNLDDPAIALPTDHFETVLYTGTGASHTISSLDFAPDLTWHKSRSYASSNALFDSVRGGNNVLSSNGTGAEVTYSDMITAFSSNGFTMGADASQAWINQSSYTYASWNWKAGGTASSNTDGSLTTSVSANTTAGFSIISYTGDDTQNSTIGHGLSQAPELAIFKPRGSSSNEWTIWMGHITGTYNEYLYLNTTAALASSAYYFGTSGPVATASTLKLGESGRTNNSASPGMICYAFHSVEGYNKIGSYNPNNSTDGPFIYTGFKPSFVLIKAMTGPDGRSWAIEDNKRDPYNPADKHLNPNLSNAEAVSSVHYVDFVSNGFKLRNAHQWSNYTGYTYFYLAFAESPFKTANAK